MMILSPAALLVTQDRRLAIAHLLVGVGLAGSRLRGTQPLCRERPIRTGTSKRPIDSGHSARVYIEGWP